MRFQSVKLCLMISVAASFVACSGQIQTRQANFANGVPVKAVAQAQLLDLSSTLDDLLKSEIKIDDIKAAIEKLTSELSEKLDVNLDEKLDVEEMANGDIKVDDIKAKIDALDIDQDGVISSEEMALVMAKWQEKIKIAREKHAEKFAEKRAEFCQKLQERIVNASDDKFLEAILLKNGLAKCAGIIADEDSDVAVTDPVVTEDPAVDSEDPVSSDDNTSSDDEVIVDLPAVEPTAPVADKVCKNVSTVSISVAQENAPLMQILIKICQY